MAYTRNGPYEEFNQTPAEVRFDYYIECINNQIDRLKKFTNSLYATPEIDGSHAISALNRRKQTLIKMKDNQSVTQSEHQELLAMPFFSKHMDVINYPHVQGNEMTMHVSYLN